MIVFEDQMRGFKTTKFCSVALRLARLLEKVFKRDLVVFSG